MMWLYGIIILVVIGAFVWRTMDKKKCCNDKDQSSCCGQEKVATSVEPKKEVTTEETKQQ